MSLFLIIPVTFFLLCSIIGYLLSEQPYRGPVSDHFDGKKFRNPSAEQAQGLKEVFRFLVSRKMKPWRTKYTGYVRELQIEENKSAELLFSWVNHSTFLFQFNEFNVLIDPIWSKRCSPFQWMGPGRKRPPGIKFESLPRIDLILISHNHYDHLDIPTLKRLIKKHQPKFIVPLGVASTIKRIGGNVINELDWWQTATVNQLEVKAVPANHFSSRGLFDRDTTLWAGFILQSTSHKVYYVGDTGYSDVFKEIGEKEGPFDLACIPIGAYEPRWFMSPIHIDPQQSVQIHLDSKSKYSVAMHYGTFQLADDNRVSALEDLDKALKEKNLDSDSFNTIIEGEIYSK